MEKLILKAGDRVMIRSDLDECYDIPFGTNSHMEALCGKVLTITKAKIGSWGGHRLMDYTLDGNGWAWNIFMFSHVLIGNRLVPIAENDDWGAWD